MIERFDQGMLKWFRCLERGSEERLTIISEGRKQEGKTKKEMEGLTEGGLGCCGLNIYGLKGMHRIAQTGSCCQWAEVQYMKLSK